MRRAKLNRHALRWWLDGGSGRHQNGDHWRRRGIERHLASQQRLTRSRAIDLAGTRRRRRLARVVLVLAFMRAIARLGGMGRQSSAIFASGRLMPTAAQRRVQQQQGSGQIGDKRLHEMGAPRSADILRLANQQGQCQPL